MSDSLIVAAEGSAPYKLLEDAGRGILTADALTSALKNGVPAATCDDKAEDVRKNTPGLLAAKMGREANAELIDEADGKPKLGRRGSGYMQRPHLNYEPSATPAAVEAK